jgi:4-amino-4-deoxy-L-arabinose transferase-like glycosyltransferase
MATPISNHTAAVAQDGSASRPGASIFYSPAWMVAVGLTVRLLCILAIGWYRLDAKHWMAFEMANIGHSLALGHGFASPWGGSTGPTAWTAPLYPWLVSLAFRVFGVFSPGAALALFTFNSVFSALTSWTIYHIARRIFNPKVASWSGWIWAVFPYAIYWSVAWIWETTLSTFLLSLLLLLTLEMKGDNRLGSWTRYGLLWGIVALTNTSIVSWLPFAGCWLAYRLYREKKRFILPVALGAFVFWAAIVPWLMRNYIVFNHLVFIRGDLGSELRVGNNPEAAGEWVATYHPGNNPRLMAQYKQMGEVAFNADQGKLAVEWIAANPGKFLWLMYRRFFSYWGGQPEMLLRFFEPLYLCLSVLGIAGLVAAVRHRVHGIFLLTTLIVFYPLVYYITFPADRYRHPIEPELLILAVWLLTSTGKPAELRIKRPAD